MHADGTPRVVVKFGVYDDDRPVFDWLRRGVEGRGRCLEAQVMDLADDVAYSVHDIEDAITGRTLELEKLADPMERAAALFVVVFPGNIKMALDSRPGGRSWTGKPAVAWGRLPLQVPLVAWALAVGRGALVAR